MCVHHANAAARIKILFGMEAPGDTSNFVLDGAPSFPHTFDAAFAKFSCLLYLAAEQAPQVAHEEEVRTSSEDTAVSDGKLASDTSTQHKKSDQACSADGSSLRSSTTPAPSSQPNSATDSRVSGDLAVASCGDPESSGIATEYASSAAPSCASSTVLSNASSAVTPAGDGNPSDTATADDGDNPGLTLLVEFLFFIDQLMTRSVWFVITVVLLQIFILIYLKFHL